MVYTNVANQGATFEITKTKFYVPVVTLSTQDNAKLLPQLKLGFKRIINWNKYLAKPELLRRNPNLNHLVLLQHLKMIPKKHAIKDNIFQMQNKGLQCYD